MSEETQTSAEGQGEEFVAGLDVWWGGEIKNFNKL